MRTLTAIALLAASSVARAQSLEASLEDKLKQPFLAKAAWLTDYDKAREEAKKTGKPIFTYFTRSFTP